jgi:hypothetical protein
VSWLWWLVWLLMSGFIVGVFAWTTKALFEQKAAWKAFAAKRKMKVVDGGFLQSVTVTGFINEHEFRLASEERAAADIRGRKFVTMFQFKLPVRMPAPGAIGTGEYRDFVRDMEAKDRLRLTYNGWDENVIQIATDDRDKIEAYFTPERLKVLDTLIKQKGVSILFLFDERDCYLRLETGDPFLNLDQLEKLIDKLMPLIKVLHP